MTLTLLSETRKACFRICLAASGIILLLVFAQSVSGKLDEAGGLAWGWVLAAAVAPLTTIWVSILLNRYPAKLFQPAAHRALTGGSAVYYGLALATLLAEPFATRGETSLVQYLSGSFRWMVPVEIFLLLGYYLAFWRKDSIFRPGAQLIQDFATEKASLWKQKGNPLRQQCFEKIAANDLPGAFDLLKSQFANGKSDDLNAAVLLQNQYSELSRQRDFNLVDPGQAQIGLNRIVMGMMNLVEKI